METTPRKLDYLPELDTLRGLAALAVMFGHVGPNWIGQGLIPWGGPLAMDVFFVLSGFLITRILIQQAGQSGAWGAFVWRRAFRLIPLLVLWVCVVNAVSGWQPDTWSVLTYTRNYGTLLGWPKGDALGLTWSLAVEEHFYLAWPLIVLMLPKSVAVTVAIGGVLVSIGFMVGHVYHAMLYQYQPFTWLYFSTHTRVAVLMMGALFAFAERDLRETLYRPLVLAAGFVVMSMMVPKAIGPWMPFQGQVTALYGHLGSMFKGCAVFLVFLAMAHPSAWGTGQALLRDRWLTGIGAISYGLYLWHWPVYLLLSIEMTKRGPDRTPLVVFAIALTFLISWACYRWFESPIREWGRRHEPGKPHSTRIPFPMPAPVAA